MADPITVEPDYYDARRASFEDIEETCPRMSQTQGSIMRFFLKIVAAECPTKLDFYRELVRDRLGDEFHELKEETTYKFRDCLIEAHLCRLKLLHTCQHLKKEIKSVENMLAESLKNMPEDRRLAFVLRTSNPSVTGGAESTPPSNVIIPLPRDRSRLRATLTCVRNILIRFHLWVLTFASGITKRIGKPKGRG